MPLLRVKEGIGLADAQQKLLSRGVQANMDLHYLFCAEARA